MSGILTEILKAAAASGALDSGAGFRRFQRELAVRTPKTFRQKVRDRIAMHSKSAHSPNVTMMFSDMIRAGEAKIVRRRGRPPLIVKVKARRTSFGARCP